MKSKIFIETIGKYLRELSFVVAGIAITVGAGLWISSRNSEKDYKQYFNAVNLEIKANVDYFEWYVKFLQKSVDYSKYLQSHDKKSLNKDTLMYYSLTDANGCGYMYIFYDNNVQTNAFEMFKISGAMRQMNDKAL